MEWINNLPNYFHNFPDFLGNFYSKGLVSVPQTTIDGQEERFFLVVYNSSTTVSAAYATFIVLAISFGIAAVFGALYYAIATDDSGGEFFYEKYHSAI